jgi:hypothetical protein
MYINTPIIEENKRAGLKPLNYIGIAKLNKTPIN